MKINWLMVFVVITIILGATILWVAGNKTEACAAIFGLVIGICIT